MGARVFIIPLALFFAMAFGQALPAIAAAFGLYLLGRTIVTIQAMGQDARSVGESVLLEVDHRRAWLLS